MFDDIEASRRVHGVLIAIMTLLRNFHGVAIRSYGVLNGDCLRSDCSSTVFFCTLSRHIRSAHTVTMSTQAP
jgi:hypothetical protein